MWPPTARDDGEFWKKRPSVDRVAEQTIIQQFQYVAQSGWRFARDRSLSHPSHQPSFDLWRVIRDQVL